MGYISKVLPLAVCLVLPGTLIASTVVETPPPVGASAAETDDWQIAVGNTPERAAVPPPVLLPGESGEHGASNLVGLGEVYPEQLPGERIDDYGWQNVSATQAVETTSTELVTAYFDTKRTPQPKQPVIIVKTRRRSTVVDAIKSLPPAGIISMAFCLFALVLVVLKGIRG